MTTFDADDPDAVLRDAREQFIDDFPSRCASMLELSAAVLHDGDTASKAALQTLVHKMAGVGGMLGFPRVSNRSFDLERLILRLPGDVDMPDIEEAVEALRNAFETDLESPPPSWALPPG